LDAQLSTDVIAWVERAEGHGRRVRSAELLPGATSSTLALLHLSDGEGAVERVLRLFTLAEWLASEPDLALHEASALQRLSAVEPVTPELIAYDPDGAHCGVPAILMTCLPGRIELAPADMDAWLRDLAAACYGIHQVSPEGFGWEYFPYTPLDRLAVPTWTSHPTWYQRLIEVLSGPGPAVPVHFIHRDYHPNNVLWRDGRLSGVVDWPNACRGPAQVDLAHCRGNLIGLLGVDVADRFLAHYCELAGPAFIYDPYWELLSISDGLESPPSVYPGWTAHGVTHLTDALIAQREASRLERALGDLGLL